MSATAAQLWNTWKESVEVREIAEAWITRQEGEWTDDDDRLYALFRDSPERGLATVFRNLNHIQSRSQRLVLKLF